jgi:hypothetical protein
MIKQDTSSAAMPMVRKMAVANVRKDHSTMSPEGKVISEITLIYYCLLKKRSLLTRACKYQRFLCITFSQQTRFSSAPNLQKVNLILKALALQTSSTNICIRIVVLLAKGHFIFVLIVNISI